MCGQRLDAAEAIYYAGPGGGAAPGPVSQSRVPRQEGSLSGPMAPARTGSPPCACSQISGWRDGALYPLAPSAARIMPELEATAPPIPV
jgi:hypothetical protein